MSGIAESKQCVAANADDHAAAERGVEDRAHLANVDGVSAAELRAITPELLQLLAATGC
jgi:hypothetical protein